ncbi:uncharacterized protein EDB91DRAFT_1120600 [Suillus paluster]|uniref:uncharacterized protein n=1 Tax=Suillus paluster TaxID=48578 RepID=UPI001B865EDE|nr:uncharacterized protein EDB91DRAFT_1120600 [Suillus paluster]KAG1745388.1 hypothetical protein EDB91DRAFT_1120600 [Suillus paluster]
MSQSNTLQLNCWFIEDDPRHIFVIRIERTQIVADLQELVKTKNVCKVVRDIDLNDHELRSLLPYLELFEVELGAWSPLSEVFRNQPDGNYLHIVVSRPKVEKVAGGYMSKIIQCFFGPLWVYLTKQ